MDIVASATTLADTGAFIKFTVSRLVDLPERNDHGLQNRFGPGRLDPLHLRRPEAATAQSAAAQTSGRPATHGAALMSRLAAVILAAACFHEFAWQLVGPVCRATCARSHSGRSLHPCAWALRPRCGIVSPSPWLLR